MAQDQSAYGFGTTLDLPVDAAVRRVTAALQEAGFGVLTTIDMQQTLKAKLGADIEPYVILGACNPQLAHRALSAVPDVGLLLPCNVVVRAVNGTTHVVIADPIAMLGMSGAPALTSLAEEARRRLEQVVQVLEAGAEA